MDTLNCPALGFHYRADLGHLATDLSHLATDLGERSGLEALVEPIQLSREVGSSEPGLFMNLRVEGKVGG